MGLATEHATAWICISLGSLEVQFTVHIQTEPVPTVTVQKASKTVTFCMDNAVYLAQYLPFFPVINAIQVFVFFSNVLKTSAGLRKGHKIDWQTTTALLVTFALKSFTMQ